MVDSPFRFKPWIVLLFATALISACAGTARGLKTSIYQHEKNVAVVDYSLSKADAMVVIRYPAIIHADAEQPYFHAFSINAIGGEVPPANRTKKATTRIAQSVIAKSNYYVMTLYRELQKELPPDTVLLSPHIIMWDRKRGIYSRPILATEQIPSVVTIDFNVYSYPDTDEMMDSPPVTFGDLVTPLFVVHSNRWVRPPTNGLWLSSNPLVQAAWEQSSLQAHSEVERKMDQIGPSYQRPLDFIAFLNTRSGGWRDLPLKSVGGALGDVIAVEDYPVEKIRMDGALLENLAEDWTQDPFAESFVKGAANRVKQTLNSVNHDKATFFARHNALARFDPELAIAFLAQSGGESVRARLQLAEALIEAERKFLASQSLGLYEGAYTGDYGMQMRQMIEGEYKLLEKRRSEARKHNVTTAVAALALVGSVYGATASGAAGTALLQNFAGIFMLGSLWAMSLTFKTQAESAEMSEHFLTLIAPALERQIAVQMEWLESKEKITAIGFAEFRNKTLSLYQARVRSLQADVTDRCVFKHPTFSEPGRWYGSCRGGLASERGYGVVRDGLGNYVEYLGTAQDGMASGTGGMIVRSVNKVGAIYYEGDFSNGLPDGTVKIEEPGRKARIREFRAGVDVGKGNASQLQSLAF
ncbi:MAG: hypothetical protein V3S21_03375 [Xanthomonadales bacterium]